jgi:hypothetical protein
MMIFPACNENANTGSGQNISVPNDIAAQANAAHAQSSVRLIMVDPAQQRRPNDVPRRRPARNLRGMCPRNWVTLQYVAFERKGPSGELSEHAPTRLPGFIDTLGPVGGLLA